MSDFKKKIYDNFSLLLAFFLLLFGFVFVGWPLHLLREQLMIVPPTCNTKTRITLAPRPVCAILSYAIFTGDRQYAYITTITPRAFLRRSLTTLGARRRCSSRFVISSSRGGGNFFGQSKTISQKGIERGTLGRKTERSTGIVVITNHDVASST